MARSTNGPPDDDPVITQGFCDEHHTLSMQAMRAGTDAVAAHAAAREEATQLKRLVTNVAESVAECIRINNSIMLEVRGIRLEMAELREAVFRR